MTIAPPPPAPAPTELLDVAALVREASADDHRAAETRGFITALMGGELSLADYTRYLAQELGPYGITANCIAPGTIQTGRIMSTVIPGSIGGNQDRSERVALRRLGTVEDCAKVVEFFTTDLSDYVTGQVIAIDGGMMR